MNSGFSSGISRYEPRNRFVVGLLLRGLLKSQQGLYWAGHGYPAWSYLSPCNSNGSGGFGFNVSLTAEQPERPRVMARTIIATFCTALLPCSNLNERPRRGVDAGPFLG